jgi:predicted secreted Zn-dependent protease
MENGKSFYPILSFGVTRRLVSSALVLLLTTIALCIFTLRFVSLVEAAKVIPDTTPTAVRTAVLEQSTPTPTPAPATPAAAPVAARTPACTPFGGIPVPSALALSGPGLQQRIDAPQTYTVYGNDATEVGRQLLRCAPSGQGGNFSGATSYWIGNQYSFASTPDGQCRLSNITVGIHVTQVLPTWGSTASGGALRTKWDAFERNLTLHENGHTIININEAQALLNDLQNLPAMSCDQIAATANTITNNHIAALNAANNNYDSQTGHGSRQGATW